MRGPVLPSPVVELRPHGVQSFAGDEIRFSFPRRDQPSFSQAPECGQGAVGKHPSFTRDAGGFDDLALAVLLDADASAARERVQRALLELRDIHE